MKIWLEFPDAAVKQLAEDLSRAALELFDAYRMNRLSGYQLCQLLDRRR